MKLAFISDIHSNFDALKAVMIDIKKNKIETRPLIAGNLLEQPFLKKYNKVKLKNSSFLHNNALYIGYNQFVDKKRLDKLKHLLQLFFNQKQFRL